MALKHFQDVALITREETLGGEEKFNRIEGYDISHFAGKEVYGSMVVFTNGVPDKSQYRLFKIKPSVITTGCLKRNDGAPVKTPNGPNRI